jgi:ABC-type sugar transport system substrate-binding protein
MSRVAIVGSRDWTNEAAVRSAVDDIPIDGVLVSGGARGVGSIAEYRAKERGLKTDIYKADWENLGKAAGMIRNLAIVNNCDKLIAFWDGQSKGTMDTVRKAKAAGIPYMLVQPGLGNAFRVTIFDGKEVVQ